jgi:hypothetical protein
MGIDIRQWRSWRILQKSFCTVCELAADEARGGQGSVLAGCWQKQLELID